MASFLFGALNGVSAFSFRFVGAYIYIWGLALLLDASHEVG